MTNIEHIYIFFFKMEAIVFIIHPSNIFGNVQNLLGDFKMGEYHSTGEYFTVVAGVISDAIRHRHASKNV